MIPENTGPTNCPDGLSCSGDGWDCVGDKPRKPPTNDERTLNEMPENLAYNNFDKWAYKNYEIIKAALQQREQPVDVELKSLLFDVLSCLQMNSDDGPGYLWDILTGKEKFIERYLK